MFHGPQASNLGKKCARKAARLKNHARKAARHPQNAAPTAGAAPRTAHPRSRTSVLGPKTGPPAPKQAPDPPQTNIDARKGGALPSKKTRPFVHNMPYSTRSDDFAILQSYVCIFSIPTRRASRPKRCGHQEHRPRGRSQSALRRLSSVGSASMYSTDWPLDPCSYGVTSFIVCSIWKACGYCF